MDYSPRAFTKPQVREELYGPNPVPSIHIDEPYLQPYPYTGVSLPAPYELPDSPILTPALRLDPKSTYREGSPSSYLGIGSSDRSGSSRSSFSSSIQRSGRSTPTSSDKNKVKVREVMREGGYTYYPGSGSPGFRPIHPPDYKNHQGSNGHLPVPYHTESDHKDPYHTESHHKDPHHTESHHKDPHHKRPSALSQRERKKNKSVKGVLGEFAQLTSFQGIPFIYKANRWWSTTFWVLIFLAGLGMSLYQLHGIFTKFYARGHSTTVDIGYDALEFPSVTVCNMNPIQMHKLKDVHPELHAFIKKQEPATEINPELPDIPDTDGLINLNPGVNPNAGPNNPNAGTNPNPGVNPPVGLNNPDAGTGTTKPNNPDNGPSVTPPSGGSVGPNDGSSPTGPGPSNQSGGNIGTGATQPNNPDNGPSVTPPSVGSVGPNGGSSPTGPGPSNQSGGNIGTGATQPNNPDNGPSVTPPAGGSNGGGGRTGRRQLGGRNKRQVPLRDLEHHLPPPRRPGFKPISEKKAPAEEIREEFQRMYGQISLEDREFIGHQAKDFIVECSFEGHECSYLNFSHRLSPTHGNCYTFNSAQSYDSPMISFRSGKTYGLELTLFLATYSYLKGITSAGGAIMAVHPFNSMPFPELSGLSVSSGMETSFGIKLVNITRLGHPYGNCTDSEALKSVHGVTYTKEACMLTCAYEFVSTTCGCYQVPFEVYYSSALKQNLESCGTDKEECVERAWNYIYRGRDSCLSQCNTACSEQTYDVQATSNIWPHRSYYYNMVNKICSTSPEICKKMMTDVDEQVPENFALVRVYYRDLNYENIAQNPDYEVATFVSDIGGTLGLWLGVSVLSGVEVLQLVVNIIYFLCRKPKRESKEDDRMKHYRHHLRSEGTGFDDIRA